MTILKTKLWNSEKHLTKTLTQKYVRRFFHLPKSLLHHFSSFMGQLERTISITGPGPVKQHSTGNARQQKQFINPVTVKCYMPFSEHI